MSVVFRFSGAVQLVSFRFSECNHSGPRSRLIFNMTGSSNCHCHCLKISLNLGTWWPSTQVKTNLTTTCVKYMKHQRSAYVSLRFHLGVPFSTSGGARSALVAFWLKGRGGEELASFDGSDLYAPSALLYARPDRIHRRLGVGFSSVGIRLQSQETRWFWFRCFLGLPDPLKTRWWFGFFKRTGYTWSSKV